jgi:hypothetical protein
MYRQIVQAVGKTHHNKKQYLETPGQLWAKDFSDIKNGPVGNTLKTQ